MFAPPDWRWWWRSSGSLPISTFILQTFIKHGVDITSSSLMFDSENTGMVLSRLPFCARLWGGWTVVQIYLSVLMFLQFSQQSSLQFAFLAQLIIQVWGLCILSHIPFQLWLLQLFLELWKVRVWGMSFTSMEEEILLERFLMRYKSLKRKSFPQITRPNLQS